MTYTECHVLIFASFTEHNAFKIQLYYCMFQWFIPFYYWMVLHCIEVPLFAYLVLIWRTFEFFPVFGDYIKKSCFKHLHTGFYLSISFNYSGKYLGVGSLDHVLNICLALYEITRLSQSGCTILHFHQQCIRVKSFICSASAAPVGTVDFFFWFVFLFLVILIGI